MSIDQHNRDLNPSLYPNTSSKVSLMPGLIYYLSVYVIACRSIRCLCVTLQNDQTISIMLSSHASSATHSEEKWFDLGGRLDSELNGFTAACPQGTAANGTNEAASRNIDSGPVCIGSKPKEKALAHWGDITSTCHAPQVSPAASETPLHTHLAENQAKSPLLPDTSSHAISDTASHSRYTFTLKQLVHRACNDPGPRPSFYVFMKP